MALSSGTSRVTSVLDQREFLEVLEGNLALDHRPLSRTIRMFVSSDLHDSKWERLYMKNRIIPALRTFCQSNGLQFHTVDMHHAVAESADSSIPDGRESERENGLGGVLYELERKGALELGLWEIKLCQEVSAGPTFVTFLGQKYGHKPLPANIPGEDFGLLCAAIEDASSKQLVQRWYREDTNALPPHYVLQTPNIRSREDEHEWQSTHDLMCHAIRRAAKVALVKDVTKVQKYTMSATEEEVTVGIFNLKTDPNQCCFWLKRTFTDLPEQRMDDPAVACFTDIVAGKRGPEFDLEAAKTLNHLREARMPAKYIGLDSSNIFEFPLKWQRGKGLNPKLLLHAHYLNDMCSDLCAAIEGKVSTTLHMLDERQTSSVHQEVLWHGTHCKEIMHNFVERKDILNQIQNYVDDTSAKPFVVYGCSGSGKTSVMAAAAYHLKEGNPLKKMAIVLRFVSLTPQSSGIRSTLQSVCEQISAVYKADSFSIPGDYKGTVTHFVTLLNKASADKPLRIFLDAIDQLAPEDGALGLSWLPLDLPPHVKLIVSTSSEVEYGCYPVLQSLLAKCPGNFIEVPELSPDNCEDCLVKSLAFKNRKLTPKQGELALAAFLHCPRPLYLQLLLREVVSWRSYSQVKWKDNPPATLIGMIEAFLKQLEESFGPTLVSHLFGYVSVAKYGLTEPELLDVLSSDKKVMEEIALTWPPFKSKTVALTSEVPTLLWSRLLQTLLPTAIKLSRGSGESLVLRLAHRAITEVIHVQYLSSKEDKMARSSMLADYFSGRLADACMYKEKEGTSPQSLHPITLAKQPLIFSGGQSMEATEQEDSQPLYNVRKLVQLPHCLFGAGRVEELKRLLTDYEWLKASVQTMPCADVVSLFTPIIPVVPLGRCGQSDVSDHELRLLREALAYSTAALTEDSSELCVQLVGRLLPFITDDTNESSILKPLVLAALQDAHPSLTPLHPFSNIPGKPLLTFMEGHRDCVSCVATSLQHSAEGKSRLCILSASWDSTLMSWDLESTGVLKTFDGHTDRVLSVAMTADGVYAVSGSEDATVREWYVPTGRCLHIMKGHTAAVNAVAITANGFKAVTGSSDSTIKVWNTDPSSSTCGQLVFTLRIHRSPVLSLVLHKDVFLASGARNGVVHISDIVSGEVLCTLSGQRRGISALAAATVDSHNFLVSGTQDGELKVWDFDGGVELHTLLTASESEESIRGVAIGPNGKVLAACGDRVISVWDIHTGAHLANLAGHTDTVCNITTADNGSLAISGSRNSTICLWDLLGTQTPNAAQSHSKPVKTVAVSQCSTYALSAGHNSAVSIYILDTLEKLKEVKAEEDTAEINHVYVLRDSEHFLTASTDGRVRLWNGETEQCLQVFEGEGEGVTCVAVTADSKLVMSGREDGKVIFWSLKNGKKLKTFTNHRKAIVSVDFIYKGSDHYILSASQDGQVCIRDLHTAKVLSSSNTHTDTLCCLSVSPDTSFLATGSNDATVHILSFPDAKLKGVLTGHRRSVRAVAILSDCIHCVTGSDDYTLRVWHHDNSECLACIHTDAPVIACTVTSNDTILYGTEMGWLSTVQYQKDITDVSTNPIVKKLQGVQSPNGSPPSTLVSDSQSSMSTAQSNPLDRGSQPSIGLHTPTITEQQASKPNSLIQESDDTSIQASSARTSNSDIGVDGSDHDLALPTYVANCTTVYSQHSETRSPDTHDPNTVDIDTPDHYPVDAVVKVIGTVSDGHLPHNVSSSGARCKYNGEAEDTHNLGTLDNSTKSIDLNPKTSTTCVML